MKIDKNRFLSIQIDIYRNPLFAPSRIPKSLAALRRLIDLSAPSYILRLTEQITHRELGFSMGKLPPKIRPSASFICLLCLLCILRVHRNSTDQRMSANGSVVPSDFHAIPQVSAYVCGPAAECISCPPDAIWADKPLICSRDSQRYADTASALHRPISFTIPMDPVP